MTALFAVFRHGQSFKGTRGDGVIKALYEGKVKDYIRCTECGYTHGRTGRDAGRSSFIRGDQALRVHCSFIYYR